MELDTKGNIDYNKTMIYKKSLKQWAIIYKGLGNPNRLKILELLDKKGRMSVSIIAEELGITLKNTSRNLIILANLDLVESEGKQDRVYYSLNPRLPAEIKQIIKITLSSN